MDYYYCYYYYYYYYIEMANVKRDISSRIIS